MCSSHLRGGKALTAEQKIRELKKLLLKTKHIEKLKKKKCIKPNDLIRKATFNLNNKKFEKYGYSSEQIEEQSLNPKKGKEFQEIYDFHHLIKVKEDRDRRERFDIKSDKRRKKLRDPLEIGEKVLVLAKHLRKKNAPGKVYKTTTEHKTFF